MVLHSWTDPHDFETDDSVGMSNWLDGLGDDLWYLRERQDGPYLNTSGFDVQVGHILVQDLSADAALTLPAGTPGEAGPFWVALAVIPEGESGFAARTGLVTLSYVGTDPVPGDRLQASNTAGFATVGTTNAFATALADGASGVVYTLLDAPGSNPDAFGRTAASIPIDDPLVLPTDGTIIPVTGAGTITAISAEGPILVVLNFDSAVTIEASGTMNLAGGVDAVLAANDSIMLWSPGGAWFEIARTGGGGGGGGGSSNATWDPYGNAVAPVATAFSVHDHWSGSGIITRLDQNADNMVFYNPAAVSIIERGIFVPTSVPSPPYTVRACIVPNLIEIDFASVALCLRESGTDKRIILRLLHDTTLKLGDLYFDDYQTLTSGTGTPSGNLTLTQGGGPIWLQMRDDGSNLFYEYSRDGENYVIYQTKSTGLHCTPDQAGFTMDSFTGGSGSAYSVIVLSFEVF